MTIEIIPAIMPNSFQDLEDHMGVVAEAVPLVQVDVMDGIYVPSRGWPHPGSYDFEELVQHRCDLPYLSELELEVDLMVATPEREAVRWIRAGARRVIIHYRSVDDIFNPIRAVREHTVPADSPLATEVGLAIDPDQTVEELEEVIPFVDYIQCMGIENVGYQGEGLSSRALSTIAALRRKHPDLIISVDGGVKIDNAVSLVEAGANRLAVGSAIWESEDPVAVIEELEEMVNDQQATE